MSLYVKCFRLYRGRVLLPQPALYLRLQNQKDLFVTFLNITSYFAGISALPHTCLCDLQTQGQTRADRLDATYKGVTKSVTPSGVQSDTATDLDFRFWISGCCRTTANRSNSANSDAPTIATTSADASFPASIASAKSSSIAENTTPDW